MTEHTVESLRERWANLGEEAANTIFEDALTALEEAEQARDIFRTDLHAMDSAYKAERAEAERLRASLKRAEFKLDCGEPPSNLCGNQGNKRAEVMCREHVAQRWYETREVVGRVKRERDEAQAEVHRLTEMLAESVENPAQISFDGELMPINSQSMRHLIDLVHEERGRVDRFFKSSVYTIEQLDRHREALRNLIMVTANLCQWEDEIVQTRLDEAKEALQGDGPEGNFEYLDALVRAYTRTRECFYCNHRGMHGPGCPVEAHMERQEASKWGSGTFKETVDDLNDRGYTLVVMPDGEYQKLAHSEVEISDFRVWTKEEPESMFDPGPRDLEAPCDVGDEVVGVMLDRELVQCAAHDYPAWKGETTCLMGAIRATRAQETTEP